MGVFCCWKAYYFLCFFFFFFFLKKQNKKGMYYMIISLFYFSWLVQGTTGLEFWLPHKQHSWHPSLCLVQWLVHYLSQCCCCLSVIMEWTSLVKLCTLFKTQSAMTVILFQNSVLSRWVIYIQFSEYGTVLNISVLYCPKIFRCKWTSLYLTLLHSERPKLHTILAFLSAVRLNL